MNQINTNVILKAEKASHDEQSNSINVQIGERVRAMRRMRMMTQSDLGNQLGITFQQVQKYERGKNRLSVATMLHIARILSVPPDLLLAGIGGVGESLPDGSLMNSSPMQVAECVNVMELYSSIPDVVWRRRACELLRLLAEATRNAA